MGAEPGDSTIEGVAAASDRDELRVLVFGRDSYTSFTLPSSGEVSIGRATEADVRTNDGSISRMHARLSIAPLPGGVRIEIEDLASANGTMVRGTRLEPGERRVISPGEVVDLGHATLLIQRPHRPTPGALISDEGPMRAMLELVERVAKTDINVLIAGETGVGKEIIAEQIHTRSPRKDGPWVRIPCDALSESAIDCELFGTETGGEAKPGIFESSIGGTVLLDDVAELPSRIQGKLLRVIEERRVVRSGSVTARAVDVRFVSTTNRDLNAEIERGAFRSDLFFRLNAVAIVVPPLRERASEIAPLAKTFAERAGAQISPAVLERLGLYPWPGNVRELKHAIERAALMAGGSVIDFAHLAEPILAAVRPSDQIDPTPAAAKSDVPEELRLILDALDRCAGNQTRAAQMLRISRGTLISRLEQYGVARPKKRR